MKINERYERIKNAYEVVTRVRACLEKGCLTAKDVYLKDTYLGDIYTSPEHLNEAYGESFKLLDIPELNQLLMDIYQEGIELEDALRRVMRAVNNNVNMYTYILELRNREIWKPQTDFVDPL